MTLATINTDSLALPDIDVSHALAGLSGLDEVTYLINVLSSPLIDSIHVERNRCGRECFEHQYLISVTPTNVVGWAQDTLSADVADLFSHISFRPMSASDIAHLQQHGFDNSDTKGVIYEMGEELAYAFSEHIVNTCGLEGNIKATHAVARLNHYLSNVLTTDLSDVITQLHTLQQSITIQQTTSNT